MEAANLFLHWDGRPSMGQRCAGKLPKAANKSGN
jgi:hypothetical protein